MLIDSHVLLWLVTDDSSLGPVARRRLADAEGVYVSAITVLELRIKQQLGRLDVPDDLPSRLQGQGLRTAPLTDVEAMAIDRFPTLVRHDPFDRALLAQAVTNGWTFLTSDRRLLALERDWIIDARL